MCYYNINGAKTTRRIIHENEINVKRIFIEKRKLPMDMSQFYMLVNLAQAGKAGNGYGIYGNYGLENANYLTGGSEGVGQGTFRDLMEGMTQTGGGMATPMDDIFEEAALATGVDVRLLKAVGKAESGFDASATSSCGAMGVMQLMPSTAASLGVQNAYDARENIMGGARYLASLLEQYHGDTRLALAAYNAGSGNVAKYGGVPPFKETQTYISRVLEYAGQDISTGQYVNSWTSSGIGGAYGARGLSGGSALGALNVSDLDYAQVFKMMMEQMKLEMEQKTGVALGVADDEEDEEKGRYL